MKKNKKKRIMILVVVAIIIIAILFFLKNRIKTNQLENQPNSNVPPQEQIPEEFVEVLGDGKKKNISQKLTQTKTFQNYQFSNIQLVGEEGQTFMTADVKNIGNTKLEKVHVDITILDKEEKEILTIEGIIDPIEPNQTVKLNAAGSIDFVDAYDFSIQIKEN